MDYRRTFLQALFVFCQDRNLDINKVATLSGFSVNALNSNSKFDITNEQLENTWKNIVQLSNDHLIGLHFGMTMQIAALNVIGQVIQTSNTAKEALHHASAFIHLLTDFYTMQIEEQSKTFNVTFKKNKGFDNFPTARNQMGDFLIAFTLYELHGLLLDNPKPIRAGLPTYDKSYDSEYKNILKCTLKKSEHYTLEFKKEYLQTKIITANHENQTLLINHINQLQNAASLKGSLSKRIFNFLIANSYLYLPTIETVSGNFNVSVRTLQRKLKEEGTSYIRIIEEVRKSLAIHYTQTSSSSVKEISSILGYTEPSGFVRAFKKWTKTTPSKFRKQIK
jgi:AraC-like DNA-binding protein